MVDQIPIWRPLLTLVLAAAVIMGSPGPSTMSVTAVGAAFGFRRSIRYLCGLVSGTIAVLLAVATGVVSLLLSAPDLAPVLLAASAAYILYLAFRIATAPSLSRHDRTIAAPSFAGGFLLAVANPKAYVAIAAVFAATTLVADAALDAALKTAVLGLMIVAIHLAWLMAGTSFARVFHDPASARIANIVFAAILVATAAIAFMP
ncbi:MAG: threonine transporter RhtB [Alphaproteobacteria bacterium RIFCSPHIGHO2_12_FULL_66_14]|nr:MAG: threonine transporter RhtB [Alphaproteobacteria bacterium RIFCSPHIGHO2_12_FULL_66_14]